MGTGKFWGPLADRLLLGVVICATPLAMIDAPPVRAERYTVAPDVSAAMRVLRVRWCDAQSGGMGGGSAVPVRCARLEGGGWEITAVTAAHVVTASGAVRPGIVLEIPAGEWSGQTLSAVPVDRVILAGSVAAGAAGGPVPDWQSGAGIDLALLVARSAEYVPAVSLAPSLAPRSGLEAVVAGFPWCEEMHVERGVVSGISDFGPGHGGQYWHVSTVAVPGESGGAVVDGLGRLVAIVTRSDPRSPGILYAIELTGLLAELRATGLAN